MQPAKTDTTALRPAVRCLCGHTVFDGQVVKARVIRVLARSTEAKCRCKRWVALPLVYSEKIA